MKKFKIVVIILLILSGIFSIIGFAADEDLEIIKIGLQYTAAGLDENKPLVLNQVDTAFEFGENLNDVYVKYFDFPNVKQFYFEKDDLYHAVSGPFMDYETANQTISTYNLSTAFVVKSNAYYIYSEGHTSQSAAQTEVNRLAGLGLKALVNMPNKSLVTLKNSKTFFGFDTSTGEYILAPVGSNLQGEHFFFDGTSYRGGIGAKRYNTEDLTLINYVRMDEYLYGVVPSEMPSSWPLEALKAQAVVARNYAYVNQNKFSHFGFNLDNTINSQVYGGHSWEGPVSNQAVDETSGILLKSDTTLVNAFYHSNSGGYTENSENVWSTALPYLVGVYDPFSLGAPNDTWNLLLSRSAVESALTISDYAVGNLTNFYISEYTPNNRVFNATFEGTHGTINLAKNAIRKLFGYNELKSTLLTVKPDNSFVMTNGQEFVDANPATLSVISGDGTISEVNSSLTISNGQSNNNVPLIPSNYLVEGKGWGHGLGMSQWGAKLMAEQGFGYDQILTFYYKGTHLE